MVYAYKHLNLDNEEFYNLIVKKSMRSESGVLVVSLFTAAYPIYTDLTTGKRKKARFSCKYDCHMCPNEPAH